jgi:hypothetical protein
MINNIEGVKVEKFVLVVGGDHNVLPGNGWTQYETEVLDDRIISKAKDNTEYEVLFKDIKSAEFGIGSGNLWLQLELENGQLNFCSPRKCWKSEVGKKLIENISKFVEIKDMKEYNHYTGKLFFIYMFK